MSAFPRRSTTLPPGEGAEQPALPQLPADIWQHIARLALVAEDGDPRAWATLRAVSTAFRAGAACAVVPPEALLTEAPVSGMAVTVRFAHPSTPEQRAWLLQTPLRLRGVHFSPLDKQAINMLQSHRTYPACAKEFHARHGSTLVELRGLRQPSLDEMDADAAAAESFTAHVACGGTRFEFPSLEGYSCLRALSLCHVCGVHGLWDDGVPKLPPCLLELTLEGGPECRLPASSADPDPDTYHMFCRGVDLLALTAVTRLTLLGMTAPLLSGGLLGSRGGPGGDSDRAPPALRTLRVVEQPADPAGGGASRIHLALMLRSSPPSLPPVRIPLLHVRADEVVCGHLQRWPADVLEPALPKAIRIQTQCLLLSATGAGVLRDIDHSVDDHAPDRHQSAEARAVRPLRALCETVRSMPAGVEEIGLGFADDRRPLRLRLRLRLPNLPSEQPSYDEVSFATAAELASSMQHLAGGYGLRIRAVRERHDDYVLVCRLADNTAVKRQGCEASCADCVVEMHM